MNKEEKEALEYFKALDKLTFEPYLSILLKLINKQQKEIESNKQRIDELNFRYNIEHSKNLSKKELIEQQQKEIECLNVIHESYKEMIEENNYISKDKIREKIKELKQKEYILSSKDSEIEILLELLEE